MTSEEIIKALDAAKFLGCSEWRYFEYGRQYYGGSHVMSTEVAAAVATMLAGG